MRSLALSMAVASWAGGASAAAAVDGHAPPSLLDTIELWLVTNFDLAPAAYPPVLAIASDRALIEMRYGPASVAEPGDVVAAYQDAGGTIFLNEDWTGDSVEDLSVLVHEYVHHLQAAAGMRFACPAEREALAYKAQDAWLGLFGTDLESAFGVDDTLVMIATVCVH